MRPRLLISLLALAGCVQAAHPALATRKLSDGPKRLWISYGLGFVSYALGLALSAMYDLSTGAIIVWVFAMLAILLGFALGRGTTRTAEPRDLRPAA